jgi:thiazole synthase
MSDLVIAGTKFSSRLFTGSGKFSSASLMEEALVASGSELVTVALRRVDVRNPADDILSHLPSSRFKLLPNTSGARDAREAIQAAKLAREALGTNWLKLEIHPDSKYLMPDPIETLLATEALVKEGFIVLPYIHADPSLAKRLENAGAAAVMPLGSLIGSQQGLRMRDMIEIIIRESKIPVIVDAGIGAPSHATEAMEMGADAVLVNSAMAIAKQPIEMARAYRLAVECGRIAFESNGHLPLTFRGDFSNTKLASASSPLTSFLDN